LVVDSFIIREMQNVQCKESSLVEPPQTSPQLALVRQEE